MQDRDRIDSLLKLADASWRDYSERRSVEWKVNFGLWTGLGIFSGFMFERATPLSWPIAVVASVVLFSAFLAYALLWKVEIQRRNSVDLNNARYYWRAVDHYLSTYPPAGREPETTDRWRKTHASQVLITGLFMLLAGLAIWAPR